MVQFIARRPLGGRRRLAGALLLTTLLIAGCGGFREGVSWPAISTIQDADGETSILVAYNDFIERVDLNGNQVFLRNSDGSIRTDGENQRRWEISEIEAANFYVAPIELEDNTLLVADYNERLLLFDATTEFVRLREGAGSSVELPGHVLADPVIYTREDEDRLVIVPLSEENVVAYNLDDNFSEAWTYTTERGVWDSPLLIEDTVYVVGMDHYLYALDAATGLEDWRLKVDGAIAGTPYHAEDENALYLGSFDRNLYRIDIGGNFADPQERIMADYGTEGWVWTTPTAYDGVFYFGDMSGYVFGVQIDEAGTEFIEVWRRKVSDGGIRTQPIVTEDYVIVGSRSGNVYWLDRASGEEVERYDVGEEILADMLLIPETEGSSRPALIVISTGSNSKTLVTYPLNPEISDEDDPTWWVYDR